MKEKMLSVVTTPPLRAALARLFREYPFKEMSASFARENNCDGICFEDESIYILPSTNCKWMLSTYLHEVAHCALIRSGHSNRLQHGEDFVLIARALQCKFGVVGFVDHNYDSQDAGIRRTQHESDVRALRMNLTDYCPTAHAIELANEERQRSRRNDWRNAAELR